MTDTAIPEASANGNSATADAAAAGASTSAAHASPQTPAAAPATAGEADAAATSGRVREAISLIKQHPLGAVATVAAATALLEIEFAVGVLAGLGATALLANKSGPERRKLVLERGRWALDRARAMKATALKKRASAQAAPPASPV